MTKEEEDNFIGSIVELNVCRHEFKDGVHSYNYDIPEHNRCSCGFVATPSKFGYPASIVTTKAMHINEHYTDYHDANGIQKIKAWLVKEVKEEEFIGFLFSRYLKLKRESLEYKEVTIEYFIYQACLSPEKFCKYFIQYCKENNLGEGK